MRRGWRARSMRCSAIAGDEARWANEDGRPCSRDTGSSVSSTTSSRSTASCSRDTLQSLTMTAAAGRFTRRALLCITLVAIVHGLFFIWYQRPDWHTQWSDQDGYRRLAEVLATTGRFTRFPDAPQFVPEVLRTPAYPLFVATIYKVAGPGQLSVVLAQTALFAGVCLLV